MHQKPGKLGRNGGGRGEAESEAVCDEARTARHETGSPGRDDLLARALAKANMEAAWKRVKSNRGSAGVDGLSIAETADYLKAHWPRIRESLFDGSYRPAPVRRVQIPKPGGGVRELGIPTVTDRLIQQALLQVLQPMIDRTFSEHSYGFRPGRRAHDAVLEAQRYVQDGYRVVVDVDLEKFFDRVNHDILMERLSRRIEDKAVLRLIRRYLVAGIMDGGVVMERYEGTPQGGPLSPLLANVLLDEVDRELEVRGHRFVRYADDCNVIRAQSQRGRTGAERAAQALRPAPSEGQRGQDGGRAGDRSQVSGLRAVAQYGDRIKCAVARKALEAFKQRIREMTRRSGGRSLPEVAERLRTYMPGWKAYFQLAQTPKVFRELDEWLRHRLRALQLKHWRRGTTIYRELKAMGASKTDARQVAANSRRWWRNSRFLLNRAMPVAYFDRLGVPRLS
ncbi:group II intron reverse transcriptase/maturase [Zoogloea sp.]|uniref:group II intron reverse transcriptase/maturase n=1 Tax=Zoogloea sp. TaxID=49181 RepID=UPI0025F768D7|nr:group II intron reverse transcriptase/maturase [Zoogloea sp.]